MANLNFEDIFIFTLTKTFDIYSLFQFFLCGFDG